MRDENAPVIASCAIEWATHVMHEHMPMASFILPQKWVWAQQYAAVAN